MRCKIATVVLGLLTLLCFIYSIASFRCAAIDIVGLNKQVFDRLAPQQGDRILQRAAIVMLRVSVPFVITTFLWAGAFAVSRLRGR